MRARGFIGKILSENKGSVDRLAKVWTADNQILGTLVQCNVIKQGAVPQRRSGSASLLP